MRKAAVSFSTDMDLHNILLSDLLNKVLRDTPVKSKFLAIDRQNLD